MSYSQHDPHVAALLDHTSELPAAERAYRYLKQQITHGHLSDNDMISEGDIGKVLSLSRTPVREAFLRLETEGFLRLYPKRGALIVPLGAEDIRDIYESRYLIEAHSAQKVAQLPSAQRTAIVAALEATIEKQEEALSRERLDLYTAFDAEFHQHIMKTAGNEILANLYNSLRDKQARITSRIVTRNADNAQVFVQGHKQLTLAIRGGNSDTYQQVLSEHLATSQHQF